MLYSDWLTPNTLKRTTVRGMGRIMRALIVEDEEELARFLARLLSKMGVISDITRTRAEAVEFAEGASYDIVVLDRRLPDGDGLRAIPDLRRYGADMPILMLTALDDVDSRIE